jgi:hypothetical protein
MSVSRLSPRISKTLPSKSDTIRTAYTLSLIDEMYAISTDAVYAIQCMRRFLKTRAPPEEATTEAIAWLTRLSWAIHDYNEYKKSQLLINHDNKVIDSIPVVLQHLRTLTTEARTMNEYFRQYDCIPRTLVKLTCTFGSLIKNKLYRT